MSLPRYIGAHMPTGKGLGEAVRRGRAIGCTAIQVFTSSPQTWNAKEITEEQVSSFRAAVAEVPGTPVVSHDSYLINLAAPDEELRQKSRAGLLREMIRCHTYGIPLVVSHMGAHVGQGEEVGMHRVAEMAKSILEEAPDDVTLLMETTAGQGTVLNWHFEQIAKILDLVGGHPRLAVCLDTCHIFAAGYDLRTPEAYAFTFSEFDRIIGLDKIKCIHCNDSKKPFESRGDRHEEIGLGEIGPVAFQCLVNDERFENVPIVVETPEAETMHEINVKRLWSYQGAKT